MTTQADPREGWRKVVWGVTIPMNMCPIELSKNGRSHWRVKHSYFRNQKDYVYCTWLQDNELRLHDDPWPAATIDVFWHYSTGRPPDDDNVWQRVSAARDAMQSIGLVADDTHIRTGTVHFVRVKKGEESVTVQLRREDSE